MFVGDAAAAAAGFSAEDMISWKVDAKYQNRRAWRDLRSAISKYYSTAFEVTAGWLRPRDEFFSRNRGLDDEGERGILWERRRKEESVGGAR